MVTTHVHFLFSSIKLYGMVMYHMYEEVGIFPSWYSRFNEMVSSDDTNADLHTLLVVHYTNSFMRSFNLCWPDPKFPIFLWGVEWGGYSG